MVIFGDISGRKRFFLFQWNYCPSPYKWRTLELSYEGYFTYQHIDRFQKRTHPPPPIKPH